jgi:hypothetical protein
MDDSQGGYVIAEYYERLVPSDKWGAATLRKWGNAITNLGLGVSQLGIKISHLGYDVKKVELRKSFEQFMRDFAKQAKAEKDKL